MPADEIVAVDQQVEVFDNMSDESILDIVKGDSVWTAGVQEREHRAIEITEARNALSVLLRFMEAKSGEWHKVHDSTRTQREEHFFIKV